MKQTNCSEQLEIYLNEMISVIKQISIDADIDYLLSEINKIQVKITKLLTN